MTDFAENNTRDIVFSGHGSGGAVALLAGANFAKTVKTKSNRIKIVTFSIPSLGDQDFKTAVEGIVGKGNIYNFCSKMDPAITSINNLTYAACLFNRKVWSANPGNHFELQQTSLRKGLTLLAAGVMFPGIILAAGAPLAASSVALGVSVGGLYLANQHHESIPVDFDGVTSKKV